jgi:transcriptional regulator with XRE-family HTH domain
MPRKAAQPLPALPHAAGQDPKVKTAFANTLRRKMREKNLTQAELARRAGLTRDNVNGYVNGAVFPRPDKLALLAKGLGCEVADLIPAAAVNAPLAEEPALDARLGSKPGTMFLRVAAELPVDVAMRIMALVQGVNQGEDDGEGPKAT